MTDKGKLLYEQYLKESQSVQPCWDQLHPDLQDKWRRIADNFCHYYLGE